MKPIGDFLITGVIGDFCSMAMVDGVLAKYKEEGVWTKFFVDACSPCAPLLRHASEVGVKTIAMMPIDLSNITDSKPIYDRYHQIIDASDVLIIFEGLKSSDSTQNAIRYAQKQSAVIFLFKEDDGKEKNEPEAQENK
jgi:hypothetical protein